MPKKISTQSKSFIALFVIAVLGTFFCLGLAFRGSERNMDYNQPTGQTYDQTTQAPAVQPPPIPPVDTSSWKTYTNKTYNFSFLYNPSWKVLAAAKQGNYGVIQIDPGKKFYNIKIYVSTQDYYILAGLPTKNDTIGGQQALNVNNMLYGVKYGNYYYTFDVGLSTSLTPDFDGLVYSVKFGS